METVRTINEVREMVSLARKQGKTIGFVPTMGALHEGHMSLIRAARRKTVFVVVSVFVNPTQFGPNEDYEKYPRNLAADSQTCEMAGADVVFAPEVSEMYPQTNTTWVDIESEMTVKLCGASRPGHFRGVATVCTKLFNIIRPDIAFFGQKDAQQVAVIKNMVADLNMPLRIEACPIVREESGLAMSSRNKYLSVKEQGLAANIFLGLKNAESCFESGERTAQVLIEKVRGGLLPISEIEIEYVTMVDPDTLEDLETIENKGMIAVAVKIGSTRLIDNIIFDLNKLC